MVSLLTQPLLFLTQAHENQGFCVSRLLSRSQLSATPGTIARQASLSMEFSRHEYWSGLPFPSPEELLNPGIEHCSSALQADSLPFQLQGSLWA